MEGVEAAPAGRTQVRRASASANGQPRFHERKSLAARTGAPWRDVPETSDNWNAIYRHSLRSTCRELPIYASHRLNTILSHICSRGLRRSSFHGLCERLQVFRFEQLLRGGRRVYCVAGGASASGSGAGASSCGASPGAAPFSAPFTVSRNWPCCSSTLRTSASCSD